LPGPGRRGCRREEAKEQGRSCGREYRMPAVAARTSTVGPTMRAAFFEGYRTMTVREAPVPEPGPDEVLLKVRACGIGGSDLSLYKTGVLAGPDVILGHEILAVVDADPGG